MRKCLVILFFMAGLVAGCMAPQYIWPQKDMASYEVHQPTLKEKVLIASRQSEFKDEVVGNVTDAFRDREVYVKVIGIDRLAGEDADAYSAVVLINTCMNWVIDRKVEAFLDKHGESDSIIVLTTSGGGDVEPDLEGRQIDAISAASMPEEVDPVAYEIIAKINAVLDDGVVTP